MTTSLEDHGSRRLPGVGRTRGRTDDPGHRRRWVRPSRRRVRGELSAPRRPRKRLHGRGRREAGRRHLGEASQTPAPARPWTHDSAAVIFSCSKGLLALCCYLLVEEGRLDMDLPVAAYWSAFARNGKGGDHRSRRPQPPGRSRRARSRPLAVRRDRMVTGHRGHRGPTPPVRCSRRVRLPPDHLRLAHRRDHSPDHRRDTRSSLPTSRGGPPCTRHLDRAARDVSPPCGVDGGRTPRRRLRRGTPQRGSVRFRPGSGAKRHSGGRLRLPVRRRTRHLQRSRSPGGRDPRRQRHQQRAIAGTNVRRDARLAGAPAAHHARVHRGRARRSVRRVAADRHRERRRSVGHGVPVVVTSGANRCSARPASATPAPVANWRSPISTTGSALHT